MKKTLWALITLACMILTGFTVYLASSFKTSEQKAAEAQAPDKSILTARVEEGQLENTLPLTCKLSFKNQAELVSKGAQAGAQYTRISLEEGETLSNGSLVAEINGQPVFVLLGGFSLYRDLNLEDRGPDARLLNQSLTALGYQLPRTPAEADQITGETYRALGLLYRNFGYPAPKEEDPILASSFIVLKEEAKVISQPRETGDLEEGPLALLSSGQKELLCSPSNAALLADIQAGQQVRLLATDPNKTYPLQLTQSDEEKEKTDQPSTGRGQEQQAQAQEDNQQILLEVPEEDLGQESSFQAEVILSSSPQRGLIVPGSALITTAQGQSLQLKEGEETRQIAVSILYSSQGYHMVESQDPGLEAGTLVLLQTEG